MSSEYLDSAIKNMYEGDTTYVRKQGGGGIYLKNT